MKKIFQDIVSICEQNTDTDNEEVLEEIMVKAKNVVMRYEWEEKYGIKLPSTFRLAEIDYYSLDDYQFISYFKDGYKANGDDCGRCISWSEDGKQPVDEWIYSVDLSTGAYMFGKDYDGQQRLFHDFFNELRTFNPDYEDLHNNGLYWKVENAKEIMSKFNEILNSYREKNKNELKDRKIAQLKNELKELTST